jgi:hypothetical protein
MGKKMMNPVGLSPQGTFKVGNLTHMASQASLMNQMQQLQAQHTH